jgi:hypothetical protein
MRAIKRRIASASWLFAVFGVTGAKPSAAHHNNARDYASGCVDNAEWDTSSPGDRNGAANTRDQARTYRRDR